MALFLRERATIHKFTPARTTVCVTCGRAHPVYRSGASTATWIPPSLRLLWKFHQGMLILVNRKFTLRGEATLYSLFPGPPTMITLRAAVLSFMLVSVPCARRFSVYAPRSNSPDLGEVHCDRRVERSILCPRTPRLQG